MKRAWIIVLAAALLLPLGATAAGATARAKPAAEPLAGHTCEENGVDQTSHGLAFTPTGFTFTLSGKSDFMCVDVPGSRAGDWTVSANATGTILRLLLVPRDSFSPGDSCGGVDLRPPTFPLVQSLPAANDTVHEMIPAATVNACGVQFGEWIDGVPVMTQTGEPHPLVFYALMQGRPGAEVTIAVTLP